MASPSGARTLYPDLSAWVEELETEDAAAARQQSTGGLFGGFRATPRPRPTSRGRTGSHVLHESPEMEKQSPRKIRQKIYRQALQELQNSTKPGENLSWSEETHKILYEKFGILERAEKTALDSVAAEVGGGGLGGGEGGTKRAREESPSSVSENEVEGRLTLHGAVSDAPLSILPGLRPRVKRIKRSTYTCTHLPAPLEILQPQPIQQDFQPHSDTDHSDAWYIQMFQLLSRRLDQFASTYFGVHDLNKGEFHQPWALDFKQEFLNYVEVVAEPDPQGGGWDALLRETGLRLSLVKAVVMKILQDRILDEDLFGAEKRECEMLYYFERSFFEREGFQRQVLRRQIVRTILGGGIYTRNFHADAAKLTAQITLLLQPLSEYLYSLQPKRNKTNPNMQDQFQSLYSIVEMAGYLSLCIKLSPSILYLVPVSPGSYYDPDDQVAIGKPGYLASRAKVTDAYQAAHDAWLETHSGLSLGPKEVRDGYRKTINAHEGDHTSDAYITAHSALDKVLKPAQDGLINRTKTLKEAIRTNPEGEGKLAQSELDEIQTSQPTPPLRTHRALCKIAIWPNIRRYKAGGASDDAANKKLEDRDGFRIREITKAVVVDYFGVSKRAKRERLGTFVEKKRRRFGRREQGLGKGTGFTLGALVGAAGLAYFDEGFRGQLVQSLAGGLGWLF